MAEIFTFKEWKAFADLAINLRIKRHALLVGMPIVVLSGLPQRDTEFDQIRADVEFLNRRDAAIEGVLPIDIWLSNAADSSGFDPNAPGIFRKGAEDAVDRVQPKPVAGSPPAEAADAASYLDLVLPERFIFENDLLPIGFVTGAARTALSVARISVTRYENGAVRISPATDLPVRFFGTAWLIGPKHIITNHHVIAARSAGEAVASEADFALQAANSKLEFDFDDVALPPNQFDCVKLLTADAALDFAIIELADGATPLNRGHLPLRSEQVEIDDGKYLPVNIVQHPGGQTKQLAIRNNAAVKIDAKNLSYFTDTQPGSSGSPVCNDQWNVVALHKAAHRHNGKFTYQGRETAWVNIGTPIKLIIDELMASGVFEEIGAELV